jgi:hypothetical protein
MNPVPLAQPDSSLGFSTSVISVLEDSSAVPKIKATNALVIKDKPSNLGLKDITNKKSWIEGRKIIDACLHHLPYCPSVISKALVTMPENQAASSCWEEVIYYYVKPPVSNLFVENTQFDQEGIEMIAHIDQYFHPSGAIDSLGCIFQLTNIKEGKDEPVITLKEQFSCLFGSLKIGGLNIEPPLQVGFMLRSLLSTYHRVVNDFKLGCHSFTTALLQIVVDQALLRIRTHGRGPSARMANTSAANQQMQRVHQRPPPAITLILSRIWATSHHWRYNCKDRSKKVPHLLEHLPR